MTETSNIAPDTYAHYALSEGIHESAEDNDTIVLLSLASSTLFSITDSGYIIWRSLIHQSKSFGETAADLASRYELPDLEARQDVGLFVASLVEAGLIQLAVH